MAIDIPSYILGKEKGGGKAKTTWSYSDYISKIFNTPTFNPYTGDNLDKLDILRHISEGNGYAFIEVPIASKTTRIPVIVEKADWWTEYQLYGVRLKAAFYSKLPMASAIRYPAQLKNWEIIMLSGSKGGYDSFLTTTATVLTPASTDLVDGSILFSYKNLANSDPYLPANTMATITFIEEG